MGSNPTLTADFTLGEVCGVYSKAVSTGFIRGKRASAIAASSVGRRRASGLGVKRSNATGKLLRAKPNATVKAAVTGSALKAGNCGVEALLARKRPKHRAAIAPQLLKD